VFSATSGPVYLLIYFIYLFSKLSNEDIHTNDKKTQYAQFTWFTDGIIDTRRCETF